MRTLLVIAHPRTASFTHALADSFAAGLRLSGCECERADLHAEGFDPRFTAADFGQFDATGQSPIPDDIKREQERLLRCEALVLAFPIYWWSFPAILKGWIDRVLTEGFAYRFTPEHVEGLLRTRKVLMLGSAGSTVATYRRYGYHAAMQRQIDAGIFGYCGIADVELHIFPQVDSMPDWRGPHLRTAHELGRTFGPAPAGASLVVR
jgi:NAD(P)H dehydrogenase (quinone)